MKIKVVAGIVIFLLFVSVFYFGKKSGYFSRSGISIEVVDRPFNANLNKFYTTTRAPLSPEYLIKLPLGSIQPGGWLLEILKREKEGMTGRLNEISAWLQKEDNAWLSEKGEGIHGWEEVPYWLKGYGDLAYLLNDSAMINETLVWINGAINSQREDGYFGPEQNRTNSKPDLWPNMVMLWCIQSYFDYSGDERVIPFLTSYFKWELNIPDSSFLKDYWGNSRAGDNLYSVYWLYNRTGDNWLLDLAEKIHRNTADWKQTGNLPNWHNVNIAQGFREPAVFFIQSKDSTDLLASYNNFNLVRQAFGQVPGGMYGADENARTGYTDPHQAIETCGMVEQMNSDELLIRFTGDPFWADNCEDVALNSFTAALTPDLKALRYFTAPNMITSDSSNHSPGIENEGPFFIMNPLSNRCCQHNHSHGWPYYAENSWMASQDNGLAAILYSEGIVRAKVGTGQEVSLVEETNYPFSDEVHFRIKIEEGNSRFPVYLRIPGWCDDAGVLINGVSQVISAEPGKFIRIENKWKDGDDITLKLPRKLSLTNWVDNKNSVSVNYGALTFSLKIKEDTRTIDPRITAIPRARWQANVDIKEWPAYTITPAGNWNYCLSPDRENLSSSFVIEEKEWPKDNYPFSTESVPIEIKTKGKRITDWVIDKNGLCGALPQSPVLTSAETEDIELIPMGASRLRISSFPVAE